MTTAAPARRRWYEAAIDRIAGVLRGATPPAEVAPTTTAETPAPRRPAANPLGGLESQRSRRERVLACRQMRRTDPRAKALIEGLARDAVRGGLRVQVTDGPGRRAQREAQRIADDVIDRLGLNARLDDWLRLAFDDGDLFLELSIAAGGQPQIVGATRKPTLQMHRASDATDRFADPARAYWQGESYDGRPPKDAVWFADFQVLHARWDHDEGDRYGRPLFASAIDSHKRVKEGEFDIAVRRKTRSGMRYVHSLPGATPEQVKQYKELNRESLDDPYAALADFFTNSEGGVQAVQGDARLSEIADVLHHVRTWALASPLPLGLLGYGEQINRDVLEAQGAQYERALIEVTAWTGDSILIPIIELEWMLHGIWPASYRYSVVQPPMQAVTVELLIQVAEAVAKLIGLGLPDAEAWRLVASVIPSVDVERLITAVARVREDAAAVLAQGGV